MCGIEKSTYGDDKILVHLKRSRTFVKSCVRYNLAFRKRMYATFRTHIVLNKHEFVG